METEKYQKELFELESPRKSAARFGAVFTRTDFAVTLTPEKLVFTAIGLMMLVVVSFALGVEKGKSAAYAKSVDPKATVNAVLAVPAVPVKLPQVPIVAAKSVAATNITPKVVPPPAVKNKALFDKSKPYMIVAVTFSREDLAVRETGKLKAAGLDAFVYYGEPYFLACVGAFQSKEGAGEVLMKVKKMHRDAYVRLR